MGDRPLSYECAHCRPEIGLNEEAWLLEIVAAFEGKNGISPSVLLDDFGDYFHEPYFLHFACWEASCEVMAEAAEDLPPAQAERPAARCTCCHSQIELETPYCVATFCEIRLSDKAPGNRPTNQLDRLGKPTPYCLACIAHVIDHFPLWDRLIEELGEAA